MGQVSAFSAGVYERLPLAQATLELAAFTLRPDQLHRFADQHHIGGTRLLFPEFLTLIRDALVRHRGSLRQAYRSRPEAVSVQSVYQRLARITLAQSEAFVSQFARPLGELLAPPEHSPVPHALRDFDVYALDGKKLKRVAKRLAQTRGVAGKLFGGKLLVCLNLHTGLVEAMAAHPDGEANDCVLVEPLLAQPLFSPPAARRRLFVADRQFGNLTQPVQLAGTRDAYLIRRSRTATFRPDPERARPRRPGWSRPELRASVGLVGVGRAEDLRPSGDAAPGRPGHPDDEPGGGIGGFGGRVVGPLRPALGDQDVPSRLHLKQEVGRHPAGRLPST